MLEFLQTGKALSVLAVIGVIGIVSKLITRSLYRRLLKETDNMAMTKNKNLKILKQKLENAYRLNQNIVNTQAYLDKQIYGFKFMNISLHGWNNVSTQMILLGLLAGGLGSFMSYWYRLDSYYIVLYVSAGALGSLFLTFLDSAFNIALKQQRLANALQEYVDNSVFVRAVRDNAARDSAARDGMIRDNALRDTGAAAAREYGTSAPAREFGTSRAGAGTVLQDRLPERGLDRDQELSERERIARENSMRDGLVREEEPRRLSARTLRPRNAKAEELLRTVRSMKEEDLEPDGIPAQEIEREARGTFGAPGRGRAGSGKGAATAAKSRTASTAMSGNERDRFSDEEKEGDGSVRRDIDYLKHSLDQIAASKERTRKSEDFAKNLDAEELKVLGEIMRQYFAEN